MLRRMRTSYQASQEREEKKGKRVVQVLGREILLFPYLCVSCAFSLRAGE